MPKNDYVSKWNDWNKDGGPKYPHEKVVQFCFRNYPPGKRNGVHALDLGCGGGVHTVFLASEGFTVSAIDISEEAVSFTRRRLDALKLQAQLRLEGADILSFPPNSFDLVVCIGVFECTGKIIAHSSVERLKQILKPGARGIFIFASADDYRIKGENTSGLYGYTRSEIEELFGDSFSKLWIDSYITTYQGGKIIQNDWLITMEK